MSANGSKRRRCWRRCELLETNQPSTDGLSATLTTSGVFLMWSAPVVLAIQCLVWLYYGEWPDARVGNLYFAVPYADTGWIGLDRLLAFVTDALNGAPVCAANLVFGFGVFWLGVLAYRPQQTYTP